MQKLGLLMTIFFVGLITIACSDSSEQPKTQGKPVKMMIIETSLGTITCELFPDKAPVTVDIISSLAEGTREWTHPGTGQTMTETPYYDGVIFHRVIPNFMIQTGDPTASGRGGPGFKFEDEFDEGLTFDKPGILAMANAGPNTNGGQIFITVAPTPHLNGAHTIFGQVVSGQEVVVAISEVATSQSRPIDDVQIIGVQVIRDGVE